jgi:hypothetical protein
MRTIGRSILFVFAVGAIFTVSIGAAVGEDPAADTMQMVREKVRTDKKLLIAENMQLTEREAAAFWPVYEQYQQQLRTLADRALQMVEHYADHYDSMSEAAAEKLLDDFITLEGDRVKILQAYRPKFAEALPANKVARYFQLENKIDAVVAYALAETIPLVK